MSVKRVWLFVACFFVQGCFQNVQPVSTVNKFNASDAKFINADGPGKIVGQAFLRRRDGVVVYAAGSVVSLVPSTDYSDERFRLLYQGRKKNSLYNPTRLEEVDSKYFELVRKTKADGEGRFEFGNLAIGSYFLHTTVKWYRDPDDTFPRGGNLLERISITRDNSEHEIIMSGN